ncbi:alpha/beta hydrolase [Aquabacterium sp. A7-Y]|uniref:alpha/beta fold hydrolase n=1 Tax=Aquabacterium sp. A7-Y TaxID=1349605 RepID=UPI00223D5DE0|nr:alpha/beta hydrolase [Aquabacterium sp. A7-Y]MCW7540842.1 alpha/beta hydrolase [Aquabacterium sp. A7-Y]
MDLRHFTLQARGLSFDAIAAGPENGPLLLCLHGFPQFADAWSGVMLRLAQAGWRVVAVDQRGYSPGARPAGVASYRIELLVQDVLAWADALGAQRFHLAGHDWGGMVGWALAAAHPERLLTLCVLSMPHPDAFQDALRHDADQRRRSIYMLLFRLRLPLAEWLLLARDARVLRRAYQGRVPAEQVQRNVERLRVSGALSAALNWYRAIQPRRRVGPVGVPTLFIWGSADQALGATAAHATGRQVAGPYRLEVLPGASHWLLEEHPDTVARTMLQHLVTAARG